MHGPAHAAYRLTYDEGLQRPSTSGSELSLGDSVSSLRLSPIFPVTVSVRFSPYDKGTAGTANPANLAADSAVIWRFRQWLRACPTLTHKKPASGVSTSAGGGLEVYGKEKEKAATSESQPQAQRNLVRLKVDIAKVICVEFGCQVGICRLPDNPWGKPIAQTGCVMIAVAAGFDFRSVD